MARINFASEKDMVDVYLEVYEENKGKGEEFYREVQLGNYGRIDLLRIEKADRSVDINILEFKNRIFELKDLAQIARYKKGIQEYADRYLPEIYCNINMQIVCTGIDGSSDLCYLTDTIDGLDIVCAEINADGVSFDITSAYSLKNPNLTELSFLKLVRDTEGRVNKVTDTSASASDLPISAKL